jgi:dTDP-glucose 4,6-dehydratase
MIFISAIKMKVLVTGGCGFIGTNFIEYLLKDLGLAIEVVNLDKQTYAGQGKNIEHLGLDKDKRYRFIKGDISNKEFVNNLFSKENIDFVFNFAAESHVDRSIKNSEDFIQTNVIGTCNLLDACLKYPVKRFIQISTDEVYGSIKEGNYSENDRVSTGNIYASSKASSEMIAFAYFKTHDLPIIITRSANNYGRYQFPEKLLPLFITNLIQGKKVPLMWSKENPGLNVRDWLHVKDNCSALWFLSQKGNLGEIYNIPGENEKTNMDMTKKILNYLGLGEEWIQHVDHRKGHDFRYSISGEKLKSLGFKYSHKDLDSELNDIIKWYEENQEWWKPLII